jgi:hypothetical protein
MSISQCEVRKNDQTTLKITEDSENFDSSISLFKEVDLENYLSSIGMHDYRDPVSSKSRAVSRTK